MKRLNKSKLLYDLQSLCVKVLAEDQILNP